MIETEQVEDGGVLIVNVNFAGDRCVAVIVGLSV